MKEANEKRIKYTVRLEHEGYGMGIFNSKAEAEKAAVQYRTRHPHDAGCIQVLPIRVVG